ncbi:MAG: hypothetical protein OEZ13_04165 [Spirochaetia bacterium]|nr:hypothetical protein [Spirochaetia bacterium]
MRKKHKKLNIIIIAFLTLAFTTQVSAKDFLSDLMKEGVATFLDTAKLIYYSFNPVDYVNNSDSNKDNEENSNNQEPNEDDLKKFLEEKGIPLPTDEQPITRKQTAKTMMIRFDLPISLLTRIFGTENMYFSDATKLGLFSSGVYGDENMTTRELLSIFLRAEKISTVK